MYKDHITKSCFRNRKGSALLVAILMMGILITLTLGLSTLVIREIRQTSDIVQAGKAYFAAEAGIEQALYDLSQSLPGYETSGNPEAVDGWVSYPSSNETDEHLVYQYRIDNKGDSYPYFPDDEPIFLSPDIAPEGAVTKDYLYDTLPDKTYNVLPLNQTVTVPLFTDNGDGTFTDVTSFLVQYYVDFDVDPDAPEFQGAAIQLENFDILRWKLFGNPNEDTTKTDAISDFYPADRDDEASFPVCIGSD
ncbi:MAG TPA: type II secretion system protein, partial [Candidatus Gracilibacteria bacterium]|nr:type II secretion system protein [Candidatus Gracilibacteria bacterium]